MQAPVSRVMCCAEVHRGRGHAPQSCPGPVRPGSGGRWRLALLSDLQLGLPLGRGRVCRVVGDEGRGLLCAGGRDSVWGPLLQVQARVGVGLRLVSGSFCGLEFMLGLVEPPGRPEAGFLPGPPASGVQALGAPADRPSQGSPRVPETAQPISSSVAHTAVWEVVRTCCHSNQPPTCIGFLQWLLLVFRPSLVAAHPVRAEHGRVGPGLVWFPDSS